MALIFALAGAVFFIVVYKFVRKIKNKILSILAQLGLVAAAVILMGLLAIVTGVRTEVSAQAGQYLFVMLILYAVINTIKNKKKGGEDTDE